MKLNSLKKDIDKIYTKIKSTIIEYYQVWFPDYKALCKKVQVSQKTIDEVTHLNKIIGTKYIIYDYLPFILLVLLSSIIGRAKGFLIEALYLNFQMVGLFSGFLGVLFLARGLNKNRYQIALECSSRWGCNPELMHSMVCTKHNTRIGLILIALGIFLQLLSLFFSAIIMAKV